MPFAPSVQSIRQNPERTHQATYRETSHANTKYSTACSCGFPLYLQDYMRRRKRQCAQCGARWFIVIEIDGSSATGHRACFVTAPVRETRRRTRRRDMVRRTRQEMREGISLYQARARRRPSPATPAAATEQVRRVLESGSLTFGVEIELKGLTSRVATQVLIDAGINAVDSGYTHARTAHWKIVYDQSLSGTSCEVVSPVLQGDAGKDELRKALNALNAAPGARIDRQCGIHVHIGGMSTSQGLRAIDRYTVARETIDTMLAPSRRTGVSGYGNPMRGMSVPANATAYADVYGSNERYCAINIVQAYRRHRTIEFRQHQGSLSATKVVRWVDFILSLFTAEGTIRPATASSLMESLGHDEETQTYWEGRVAVLSRERRAA